MNMFGRGTLCPAELIVQSSKHAGLLDMRLPGPFLDPFRLWARRCIFVSHLEGQRGWGNECGKPLDTQACNCTLVDMICTAVYSAFHLGCVRNRAYERSEVQEGGGGEGGDLLADVRLRPRPPARVEMRKAKVAGLLLKRSTIGCRSFCPNHPIATLSTCPQYCASAHAAFIQA